MNRALAAFLLAAAALIAACPAEVASFKGAIQPLIDFGGNDTGLAPASNLGAAAAGPGAGTGAAEPTPGPGASRSAPGTLLATIPVGVSPRGLALDSGGRVWAAVSGSDMIARLDGNAVAQRISVTAPNDLAFDAAGRAWVATGGGVLGFDATGSPLQGAAGSAAEAIVASGEFVYASFPREGVIQRYGVTRLGLSAGMTLPGSAGSPRDLLIDDQGRLWAALGAVNLVARYGNPAATPSAPTLIGNVGGDPSGLARDATGGILAVGNSSVVAVSGATPSILIQNSFLMGGQRLAVDRGGTIWVAANTANRLVGVKAGGTLTDNLPVGLAGPWDVVVDRQGDVWVSNEAGGTVMRFSGS